MTGRRRALPTAIGLSTLMALSTGCSFLFTGGPPPEHGQLVYFDCSSSAGNPLADLSATVVSGAMFAAFATREDAPGTESQPMHGPLYIFGAATLAYAASTVYGVVQTGRCADAKQALASRISDMAQEHGRLRAANPPQPHDLHRGGSGPGPGMQPGKSQSQPNLSSETPR